jgi:bifunctional non-homologous end joining protein LigD
LSSLSRNSQPWIHEIKHDGYRTLLIIERRKARAYSRNGFDWGERYAGIIKAATKLDCRSAIIDGEVIVQNEQGISDFDALKSAIASSPVGSRQPSFFPARRTGGSEGRAASSRGVT